MGRLVQAASRRSARGAAAALVGATLLAGLPGRAAAQAVASGVIAGAEAEGAGSLGRRVGLARAVALLESDDRHERLRGVERLAALGTEPATSALARALEQGTAVSRDPRARLAAVRGLAPHAPNDVVQQALLRELTDTGLDGRGADTPLGALTRETAALALARHGGDKALAAMTRARLQGSVPAGLLARALAAYPPRNLESLVGAGSKPTPPEVAALLGEVGELRAVARLRATLAHRDPGTQAAAALALARLGDPAPLPHARAWATRADARLLPAAAEALALLGAPEARAATIRLLDDPATRSRAVGLALRAPSAEVAGALAGALGRLDPDDRPRALTAIGRAGGAAAIAALRARLADPELAAAAARALAEAPGDAAREALEAELAAARDTGGARLRLAARAATVRALRGEGIDGLEPALTRLLASKDAADRGAAAFGLISLSLQDHAPLLTSRDEVIACAAARGAAARGGDALAALVPILERLGVDEPDGRRAVAAGLALLADPAGGAIASSRLAAWAEGGGPLAPLAARALGSRDHAALRPRITRLLAATDPTIRAHVALGLARDPKPDAASLLAGAYRFEADASVRRAVVRALAARREPQREATLALARDLDPDAEVRALARSALAGRGLDRAGLAGDEVAWIVLDPPAPLAARVAGAGGLALPVIADPDGVLVVAALPAGPASVVLAPSPSTRDPAAR
jgi:HEAT repeat protein